MFRPTRRRHGRDPTLPYRMLLFALGALTGLGGMATERSWLVLAGTIFLAAGLVIAMVAHRQQLRAQKANDDG